MDHTTEFFRNAISRPDDAAAITEVPEAMTAELGAAGISAVGILPLLPKLILVIRWAVANGGVIQGVVPKVMELVKLVQAGDLEGFLDALAGLLGALRGDAE